MFEINGLQINIDGLTLIQDLKTTLNQNGIVLLESIKPGIDNIQFSCPSHKGGQEHKPSCGMSLTTIYRGDKKIEAGTVHCFTCGYTATLPEFISFCFGYKDGGVFGNKWLKKMYSTTQVNNRSFNLGFRDRNNVTEYKTISEDILDSYRFYHSYMYKRGLTDEVIEDFDIGYDKEADAITFPVADLYGNIKWVQKRSVNTKFYHIPEGITKTDFLYGADKIVKENIKDVVIVESPLNALTLWKLGKPAVALFGTGGGKQYELLLKLPARHYLLALDNDDAGKEGTKKLIKKLYKHKLISQLVYPTGCQKDINDYDEEILKFKKIDINF